MIDLLRKITITDQTSQSSKLSALLTISSSHLAYVIDQTQIELVNYNSSTNKAIIPLNRVHQQQITCLRFSEASTQQLLLCSCSIDHVLIWNVLQSADARILKTNLQFEPSQCAFHPYNKTLAVCYGHLLTIIQIESGLDLCHFKSTESISGIEFFQSSPNLLVATTNQTDSIQVFSTNTCSILQTLSDDSFNLVSSFADSDLLVASTLSGNVNIYQLCQDESFKLHKRLSLEALFSGYLKTKRSAIRDENDSQASFLCLNLQLFGLSANSRIEFDESRRTTQSLLICGTTACLFFIDCRTFELISLVDLGGLSPSKTRPFACLPQAIECRVVKDRQVNAAFLMLFQAEICVVKCADIRVQTERGEQASEPEEQATEGKAEGILSVFPKMPLLDGSPLKEKVSENEKVLKKAPSMQEYLKKTTCLKPAPISKDKPLTYHSKIKSSGYRQTVDKREKFTPVINKPRSYSIPNLADLKLNQQSSTSSKAKSEFCFELPVNLDKKFSTGDRPSSVVLMKFADDGSHLAISTSDNVIQYLNSSNLDKPGPVFNVHKNIVRSIDVSHDCKYLLSTGEDRTCKLWSVKKSNGLLIDIAALKMANSQMFNFKKELVAGCFFYVDKFFLLGTENKLLLCKYFIDYNKNDVQRYLSATYTKLVTQLDLGGTSAMTTLSAVNSFYSYIVIAASSDRAIQVFDMNVAKCCLTIDEAHSRSMHQICQNTSQFNQGSYDMFLTSAVGDGVKMWDLRNGQCVNHFDVHVNTCLPTKASFSPDSNYVAVGSEDRSALVYDLRMNGTIQKYGLFSDSVTNCQFNPCRSQFVCGTQDGRVYSYGTAKTGG